MKSISRQLRMLGTLLGVLAIAGCGAAPADTSSAGTGAIVGAGAGGAAGTMVTTTAGVSGASGIGGASGTTAGSGGTSVPAAGMSAGAAGDVSGAAGVSSTAGTGGELMCGDGAPKEGMCKDKAAGIYAIKVEIDVWWKDNGAGLLGLQLVDPGRDKITIYLKGELTDVCPDGTGGLGTISGCGTVLPPFRSDANCDSFDISFPNELWDQLTMPKFVTTGSTTGFNPGDILTLNEATGMIGISLDDTEGAWPTYQQTGTITCPEGMADGCFPDHDGDGHPGITVQMGRIGQTDTAAGMCGGLGLPFIFRGAPLDGGPAALVDDGVKANTIYIGLRVRLGGAGAIGADCNSGVGDSTADFLDSRVIGCVQSDGMNCPFAAQGFVDSVAPVYHILNIGEAPPADLLRPQTQGGGPLDQTPSIGPRSALVRIGDLGQSFACDAIRNAPFPEL